MSLLIEKLSLAIDMNIKRLRQLKKDKHLSEYGEGQLEAYEHIKKIIEENKEK